MMAGPLSIEYLRFKYTWALHFCMILRIHHSSSFILFCRKKIKRKNIIIFDVNCVFVHCTLRSTRRKKNPVYFHDYLNYCCSNQCQTLNWCCTSLSSIHFFHFFHFSSKWSIRLSVIGLMPLTYLVTMANQIHNLAFTC